MSHEDTLARLVDLPSPRDEAELPISARQHLATCASCRAVASGLQRLAAEGDDVPPGYWDDLSRRVAARVRSGDVDGSGGAPVRPRRRATRRWAPLAAAAALLLAVLLVVRRSPDDAPGSDVAIAAAPEADLERALEAVDLWPGLDEPDHFLATSVGDTEDLAEGERIHLPALLGDDPILALESEMSASLDAQDQAAVAARIREALKS